MTITPAHTLSTKTNLDATANPWFYTNYGITFDHMYMYFDLRDTWDQYGISNGWKEENYISNVTGKLFLADTTDFVTIDWLLFGSYPMSISIYDAGNNLLDTFIPTGTSGTTTMTAPGIARLELGGTGGYSGISGLTYNMTAQRTGTMMIQQTGVPEPATMLLLGLGLVGLAGTRRMRS